jgi:hypothetical protein|tara:strand:+ start:171 stop:521 length:351 start_codon:yes stop_codon:yes gene_type:complete
MQDNFIFKDKYPYKAGHRKVDTSIQSANFINKNLKRISKVVLVELGKVFPKGLTGSEIAHNSDNSILSVRPRTTELKLQGLIIDTEERRKNKGGQGEIIYKLRGLEVLKDYDINVD